MAWTSKQKSIAAMACKAAGISDEQRRDMILRSFANAHYKGDITSTSPKLTNPDLEQFMAIVESYGGGQLLKYPRGNWHKAAGERWSRMKFACERFNQALIDAGRFTPDSLGKWIEKHVAGGTASRLDQLDYHGLLALMLGLKSFCRQKEVAA